MTLWPRSLFGRLALLLLAVVAIVARRRRSCCSATTAPRCSPAQFNDTKIVQLKALRAALEGVDGRDRRRDARAPRPRIRRAHHARARAPDDRRRARRADAARISRSACASGLGEGTEVRLAPRLHETLFVRAAGGRRRLLDRLSAAATRSRRRADARADLEPDARRAAARRRVRLRALPRPTAARAQAAVERVGRGETPPPLPESGPSEIATLNRGFNAMTGQPAPDRARSRAAARRRLARPAHAARPAAARHRDARATTTDARDGMVADIEEMDRIIGQFLDFARDEAATRQRAGRCHRDRSRPASSAIAAHGATCTLAAGDAVAFAHQADVALAARHQPDRQCARLRRAARSRSRRPSRDGIVVIDVADRGPGIAAGRRRAAEAAVHAGERRARRAKTASPARDSASRSSTASRACTAAASTCCRATAAAPSRA